MTTILLLVSSVPVTLLLGPVGVGVWLLAAVLLWRAHRRGAVRPMETAVGRGGVV